MGSRAENISILRWQIQEEGGEEEIPGQMGVIIPPGCRPTVSALSVMPSVPLNRLTRPLLVNLLL